jgi:hypothetical protein
MHKIRIRLLGKLFLLLTGTYLSIGIITGLVFYFLLPAEYIPLYYTIVLFFWLIGMRLNYAFHRRRHASAEKLLNIFLLARMIKFFCTVAFLLLYVLLGGKEKKAFAICLMSNYMIYSTLEVYIYHLYNKRITEHEKGK